MRGLGPLVVGFSMAVTLGASQLMASGSPYLSWSAADAERIGKSTRVNGRVGGALDFRVYTPSTRTTTSYGRPGSPDR